jgi:hypothetical protein
VHKTWDSVEHVGKVTISILNLLSKEFHKEAKKEKPDYSLLTKLSSACGYQAQLYSGLQKNHEFAKRLEEIENSMKKEVRDKSILEKYPPIYEN